MGLQKIKRLPVEEVDTVDSMKKTLSNKLKNDRYNKYFRAKIYQQRTEALLLGAIVAGKVPTTVRERTPTLRKKTTILRNRTTLLSKRTTTN